MDSPLFFQVAQDDSAAAVDSTNRWLIVCRLLPNAATLDVGSLSRGP